jgi:hypothetical protein
MYLVLPFSGYKIWHKNRAALTAFGKVWNIFGDRCI